MKQIPRVEDILKADGTLTPSEPGAPGWQAGPQTEDGLTPVYFRCMCGQPALLCVADEVDAATGVVNHMTRHRDRRCGFRATFRLEGWAVFYAHLAEDGA